MRFATPQLATRVAGDCALTLTHMLRPDGTFIYRYMLPEPDRTDALYSNIRHIAAVWFLLEVDKTIGPLPGVRNAAIKSGDCMIENFFAPYSSTDMLCVLDEGFIKLGGAGLALNALCSLYDATSDERYLTLAGKIAAYVLKQRRDDGDFVHVRPYPIGPVHPSRSNFFTGQALMGLLAYWQQTRLADVLDAAMDSVAKLDKQNIGVKTTSHWMLYALEQAYKARPDERTLDYARRISETILSDKGYRTAGTLTSIACGTEGILAFDRLLQTAGQSRTSKTRAAILKQARQNLSVMLKFKADGGIFFQSRARPEVRIDYIAHAGLCFLGYSLQAASDTR